MEGIYIKKLIVFVGMATLLLGSCSKGHRIVGSWTDIEDIKWVFSADGKLEYENSPGNDSREYRYSVFEGERRTELTIFEVDYDMYIMIGFTDQVYNAEYSKDGKTLRLTGADDLRGWRVAGPGWGTNQLTKK